MSIHTTALPFADYLEPIESFTLYEHIIEDRGSRYSVSIGRVTGRNNIKAFLTTLKKPKAYQKADHHSYAARILREGAVFETKSDDGETGAGLVILRLMQRHNVINGIICVTRWFGGTKLEGDRYKHVQDATVFAINQIND